MASFSGSFLLWFFEKKFVAHANDASALIGVAGGGKALAAPP
jgi:hypothetical protein